MRPKAGSRETTSILPFNHLEKILAEREGKKQQAPGSSTANLGYLFSHHWRYVLYRPSNPPRGCLCHTLYPSRIVRVFPATRVGYARYSSCLFHLNNRRNFVLTPTSCCPYLESTHEPWVSSFRDLDHCHSVVSSQCAYRPTGGGPRSNTFTGRPTAYLRGMQKNS